VVTVLPAAAQGVAWNADYFNNPYLYSPAALTRQDGAIAFDWGSGSPGSGVNPDSFSVRWGADPYFSAGTYRFFALADDFVSVNVGFARVPQINTFDTSIVGQIATADIQLSEGAHHVQVDYRENTGTAYVYVTWVNLATNPNPSPNFPVPYQSFSSVNTGSWTAQYYGNTNLSGGPALTQTEAFPSHDWGGGSPGAGVPADNFSARWTSTQNLSSGNYRISVRADDGVRVFVNGNPLINSWNLATPNTYTADFTLPTGGHNFVIEYFEAGGNAFLNYSLTRTDLPIIQPPTVAQPGQPVATGTTGTINAFRLNVRNAPNTGGAIIAKVNRNETYPVVGANADRTWYQINVNGNVGWVFGRYLNLSGGQNVPVTSSATTFAQAAATDYTVIGVANVNIRSQPGTGGAILGRLNAGNTARIVGRNSTSTWWQVDYNGLVGWVSSRFARIQQAQPNLNTIPITG
jgi:uncharacterized protein YraI